MFVVLLRFGENRAMAAEYMEAHNSWLQSGFDDGVFLLAGSIVPGAGGGVLAHNSSLEEIEARVKQDPFVIHEVVNAEVIEISPARADERLQFLLKG